MLTWAQSRPRRRDRRHAQPCREGLRPSSGGRRPRPPAARGLQRAAHLGKELVVVMRRGDHRCARVGIQDLFRGEPVISVKAGLTFTIRSDVSVTTIAEVLLANTYIRQAEPCSGRGLVVRFSSTRRSLASESSRVRSSTRRFGAHRARARSLAGSSFERELAPCVDVTELEKTHVRPLPCEVKGERQRARAEHREREVHQLRPGREGPNRRCPRAADQEQRCRHPAAGEHQRAVPTTTMRT